LNAPQRVVIFTDGACSGNPGPGGWGAVLVSPLGKVKELGGGDPKTTNNRMEMTAAIEALKLLAKVKTLSTKEIRLYTDSTYLIKGICEWIRGWKKRGWKNGEGKDVSNRELWEALDEVIRANRFEIEWLYIPGHEGYPGNERCDVIAVSYAKGNPTPLYDGPRENYGLNLERVPAPFTPTTKGPGGPKPAKGPAVYLSLVNGEVFRDAAWKACEARVKGRPGARFKKVESPEEEASVLRSWGK
jgi:ribonuclease HI